MWRIVGTGLYMIFGIWGLVLIGLIRLGVVLFQRAAEKLTPTRMEPRGGKLHVYKGLHSRMLAPEEVEVRWLRPCRALGRIFVRVSLAGRETLLALRPGLLPEDSVTLSVLQDRMAAEGAAVRQPSWGG